jgi:hypothetical protein
LRSRRFDSASALRDRAMRSGTRRLGLRMPGGGPEGCRSFPWRSLSRARHAREAKRDQYQVIEITGFRFRNSGESRSDQANRQQCQALAAFQQHRLRGRTDDYTFLIRSRQGMTLTCLSNGEATMKCTRAATRWTVIKLRGSTCARC